MSDGGVHLAQFVWEKAVYGGTVDVLTHWMSTKPAAPKSAAAASARNSLFIMMAVLDQ
jgi:hypothetical protein